MICTYVVIGPARTSPANDGMCGTANGGRSRDRITFVSDSYGIFGEVSDRVAKLTAVDAARTLTLTLTRGSHTLPATERFFALPFSVFAPDYLVARGISGKVLARIPMHHTLRTNRPLPSVSPGAGASFRTVWLSAS